MYVNSLQVIEISKVKSKLQKIAINDMDMDVTIRVFQASYLIFTTISDEYMKTSTLDLRSERLMILLDRHYSTLMVWHFSNKSRLGSGSYLLKSLL